MAVSGWIVIGAFVMACCTHYIVWVTKRVLRQRRAKREAAAFQWFVRYRWDDEETRIAKLFEKSPHRRIK